MKTILVPMLGVESDKTVLELASRVARRFAAHIDGLHVQRSAIEEIATLTMGEGMITQEIWDTIEGDNNRRAETAKAHFVKACLDKSIPLGEKATQEAAWTAGWQCYMGNFRDEIVAQGRLRDLIVVGREHGLFGFTTGDLGAMLMACGRPMLFAPQSLPATMGKTLAIAWKDTAESAHALTAAMPLIKHANHLVLLAAAEGGDAAASQNSANALAAQLRWHGCDVDVRALACGHRRVAEVLVTEARTADADMLVIGGYGHSRAREFVLVGVTRDLLEACSIPLLVTH